MSHAIAEALIASQVRATAIEQGRTDDEMEAFTFFTTHFRELATSLEPLAGFQRCVVLPKAPEY